VEAQETASISKRCRQFLEVFKAERFKLNALCWLLINFSAHDLSQRIGPPTSTKGLSATFQEKQALSPPSVNVRAPDARSIGRSVQRDTWLGSSPKYCNMPTSALWRCCYRRRRVHDISSTLPKTYHFSQAVHKQTDIDLESLTLAKSSFLRSP
jgi:hypothetical protein